MENSIQTKIAKDLKNEKITVVREFDAAMDLPWRAWTESVFQRFIGKSSSHPAEQ
jgi:hypothetical protein